MKKLFAVILAIAFSWGCSGSSKNPISVGGQNYDNLLGLPSIDNPATIQVKDFGAIHLSEDDISRLIDKGELNAADLDLEGGLCPVLIDCWWVDESEFWEDWLWENYCWPLEQSMMFVWLAKLPDPNEPCPIMPTDIWGWLAFTQCEEGKPQPRLHSNIIDIEWGSMEYYKGLWYFYVTITVTGMPPGYHDAIFVNSWDGPELLPFDDACGIDFWESEGGGLPPNLFMVFNPEPPFPPGGWPPCRLDGEDGETRPWCVLFEEVQLECHQPVAESTIDSPGTTGWPFILGNLCTANVSGDITKIGVDRWNTTTATWDIYLWDSACNLIASASVTGGSGWYFADIPPYPVNAGDQFYISYEVDESAGSYLYRDTVSPIDLGYYTVEYASYNNVGYCPNLLNGYLVSPVDVEICVPVGTVVEPEVTDNAVKKPVPAATDGSFDR